jgi:membrane-associated phospholipid phosphatase
VQASSQELGGLSGYFYNIDEQFIDSFVGYNSLNHATAIGSTAYLVNSDIDWHYYNFFNNNKYLQLATFPAVIVGGIFPVTLPIYLHYVGVKQNNRQKLYTAYAVGQSAVLSVIITSMYKSVTGRLEPEIFREERTLSQSKQFEFGFWNNGIFNGWPSGHATTAMAIAVSYAEMTPAKKSQHIWWYLGALYISFGISTNIHWLSDAIAGSLIGYGIGKSVGQAFSAKLNNTPKNSTYYLPFIYYDTLGISIGRRY